MNFDLKSFLKALKLNENNISILLGALVIVVVGILVVNYFKDKKGTTIPAISTTQNEVGGSHTVKLGETLWSIAEDNYGSGYNWVDIKSENKLASDSIDVDQKISIPDVPTRKPTATQKLVSTTNNVTAITADTYTVQKGDSLWKIAVRAYGDGYKWVEIAKLNKLVNPNIIHSGNVLALPR